MCDGNGGCNGCSGCGGDDSLDIVRLTDENGTEVDFFILGTAEVNGVPYIALAEVEQDQAKIDAGEGVGVVVLKIVEDGNGEQSFSNDDVTEDIANSVMELVTEQLALEDED